MKKDNCTNCKNAIRINFINNTAVDVWCGKHNTEFTPESKCIKYKKK